MQQVWASEPDSIYSNYLQEQLFYNYTLVKPFAETFGHNSCSKKKWT